MISYEAYIKALTGYDVTEGDLTLISAIEDGEKQHILNYINATELPEGLAFVLRDLVTAKFLTDKSAAVLGDDNLNVAKAITEGDVSIQLAGTTAEERLNGLISTLLARERDLVCYRQIQW